MNPISLAIWGPTGTTKSSIALSFPRVVCFDFDLRLNGVRKELLDRLVRHYKYPRPVKIPLSGETRGNQMRVKLDGYRECYDQFVNDLVKELKAADVDTIVIDTATQMREIANDGYLQELQEMPSKPGEFRVQLQQMEYSAPNGRIQSIYQAIKSSGKNMVLTHYEDDEYVDTPTFDPRSGERGRISIKTGQKVLKGYNKTAELVDLMLVTSIEKGVPYALVTKAGLALEMMEMKLMNPSYDVIISTLRMFRPEWEE